MPGNGVGDRRVLRIHLTRANLTGSRARMDPHERAVSVWYRIAGLISREQKSLAVEIIEAEIRSAQHEVLARGREAGADHQRARRDRSASP